ncbi:hypothetical protein C1H76_4688 [Elsinoe australis]|uniref:Uncharacterized protein n=1 Tax=Elsinoe australis TaxID=40998 RepID=A0A4U7B255_9PEZI|nr:hypothetical protein C1H76_4688 [Elsinoe australis]
MTCRTIYSEAIVIFYRDCHLDITSLGSGSSGCLRALSRFPKSIQIARVRKLTFSFSLNHTAPNQFEKIFKLFHWGRHLNELLIVFQHPYASHDGYDNSRWRVGDGEKSMDNDDLDTHIETVTKESLVPLWKKLTFPKPILVWTSEHWAYRTWEPDVQVMMQIKDAEMERRRIMGIESTEAPVWSDEAEIGQRTAVLEEFLDSIFPGWT